MVFKKKKHEEKVAVATWDEEEFYKGQPENPDHIRTFETGATRDTDTDKYEYAGFFAPAVLKRRAAFMHKHRFLGDGTRRDSGNWKLGMDREVYMQSLFRHFIEVWDLHEAEKDASTTINPSFMEEALCALMFNAEGYLFEYLKGDF